VDRPPENSLAGTIEELERLQRLALVSGENAPPESLAEVMEEVENWLNSQIPDSVSQYICCAVEHFRLAYYEHDYVDTHLE
jgi:hypothetical protein